jgi:hypothetical protein
VRAGIERRELRFDLRQQLPDPFPVQLPGNNMSLNTGSALV